MPKDAPLLDIGCGSGQVGVRLQKVGFNNMYCNDCSGKMVQLSMSKNVYKDGIKATFIDETIPETL